MRYRKLPLEKEFETILKEQGPQALTRARTVLFDELRRHRGFEIIALILRALEQKALAALRLGIAPDKAGRALGRLECIEEIRRSLDALLPVAQQSAWHDEEEEAFVNLDSAE